jgi:hemoglobin
MTYTHRPGPAFLLLAIALTSATLASAPLHAQQTGDSTKPISLYDRLGGKNAISAVVNRFVSNVAADTAINRYFSHTNIPRLKNMLVDQICQASGGPCKYRGRDMKSTHRGMGITTKEFNDLVGDLVAALDSLNVPEREKKELLAALAPMKRDIVEKP